MGEPSEISTTWASGEAIVCVSSRARSRFVRPPGRGDRLRELEGALEVRQAPGLDSLNALKPRLLRFLRHRGELDVDARVVRDHDEAEPVGRVEEVHELGNERPGELHLPVGHRLRGIDECYELDG